jgi:catechol 2,3-dioxygenase-like lactoylglutathione lyase family enzyme
MKRVHVHVRVMDLDQSIGFYSTLFGVQPAVLKPDYAKWMLDDPRVNFAISTHTSNASRRYRRTPQSCGQRCRHAKECCVLLRGWQQGVGC